MLFEYFIKTNSYLVFHLIFQINHQVIYMSYSRSVLCTPDIQITTIMSILQNSHSPLLANARSIMGIVDFNDKRGIIVSAIRIIKNGLKDWEWNWWFLVNVTVLKYNNSVQFEVDVVIFGPRSLIIGPTVSFGPDAKRRTKIITTNDQILYICLDAKISLSLTSLCFSFIAFQLYIHTNNSMKV